MFRSADMVYHATRAAAEERFWDWPVGHFYWEATADMGIWLWMKLPRQDGDPAGFPLHLPTEPVWFATSHTGNAGPWKWDGNIERPTLTPSVFVNKDYPQDLCHWHGWIQGGRMVGC